uniref:Uncharacterized protein n=1 Tax=Timema bartmani TaxID=61472 RepID=A0A7R9HZH0_9NEOP|nr:unnamed protein product [Timema bartmani]
MINTMCYYPFRYGLLEGYTNGNGLLSTEDMTANQDVVNGTDSSSYVYDDFWRLCKETSKRYACVMGIFKQFFTKYLIECNGFSDKPIYIGILGEDGQISILLENGTKEDISSLQSDLEKADERLLLHLTGTVGRWYSSGTMSVLPPVSVPFNYKRWSGGVGHSISMPKSNLRDRGNVQSIESVAPP